MRSTRRRLLQAVGAGVLGSLSVATRSARATHPDQQPDHVTLEFDQSWLEKYRPRLVFSGETHSQLLSVRAWRARSPELPTDVGVYWAEYSHQEGATDWDSHAGDHEPLYVFVDDVGGEVVEIRYSAYHWMTGAATPALEGDTHAKLRVIDPYHHYSTTSTEGVLPEIKDLNEVFQLWLDEGLESALEPGVVVNPWRMLSRHYWWADDVGGFSWDAMIASLKYRFGIAATGDEDPIEAV